MTQNLNINSAFAINKAKGAVDSWKVSLAKVLEANDVAGIAFCTSSLKACERNLEVVRKDVKENWHAYL